MTEINVTNAVESRRADLSGRKFGRLSVVRRSESVRQQRMWLCLCDCGSEIVVPTASLKSGNTKSCGCFQKQRASEGNLVHGHTTNRKASKAFNTWFHIVDRCGNPNNPAYANYGARGIRVCDEWVKSFEEFYRHVGEPPSRDCSLDRIDNERGYEPGNVRWTSAHVQRRNKRTTVIIATETEARCEVDWRPILNTNWLQIIRYPKKSHRLFEKAGLTVKWYGKLPDAPEWVRELLRKAVQK